MKKLLKALGITITLTAIGVGVRARVENKKIEKAKIDANTALEMIQTAIDSTSYWFRHLLRMIVPLRIIRLILLCPVNVF